MDAHFICYCGLYCENCAVKARVEPAARVLLEEMKRAGFADIVDMIPGGHGFWAFLTSMAEEGTCASCQEGSGNPNCTIRLCARDKDVTLCALCGEYPCAHFAELFTCYPGLDADNTLAREKGLEAWGALQDERRTRGFTYPDEREKTP